DTGASSSSPLLAHLLLDLGEARLKRRSGEHVVHVALDRLRVRRKLDVEQRQPPQDRRDRAVDQRELVAQEEALRGEDLDARQDALLERLDRPGNRLAVVAFVDLLRKRIPILLDTKQREPEVSARD